MKFIAWPVQLYRKIQLLFPTLTRNQLKSILPIVYFLPVDVSIKFLVRLIREKSIRYIPTLWSSLLTNYALLNGNLETAKLLARKSQGNERSRFLAFNYEIQIADMQSIKKRDHELAYAISDEGIKEGRFGAALSWSAWNLPLVSYAEFVRKVMHELEIREENQFSKGPRLLPQFTTHMGHLGYLSSYLSYYQNDDPQREIVLWPEQAPNRYYADLLIEQSPLKVISKPGKSPNVFDNPNIVDTLTFSRRASGEWRYEYCGAVCSGQLFPELIGGGTFKLTFPPKRDNEAISLLERIGFNAEKWFVILHIRESAKFSADHSQVRDSKIEKFESFCELIQDLGGQVVRMGNQSFPKLPQNFRALDYAHSSIRSDVIDCWLWANCKWWTGNPNGASQAAQAFGAPRVILDQWFWDNFGPAGDIYIPKLLKSAGKILNIRETVEHKLSRNMNLRTFEENELTLIDNTNLEIQDAALDMFNSLSKVGFQQNSEMNNVDQHMAAVLRNPSNDHTMRIAPSFISKIKQHASY